MSNHGRFQDLEWYTDQKEDIIIGGAGGIGSWLILFLGRIGHSLHVFDFDSIDNTNFGGQLYPLADVGKGKAGSIKETVEKFCGEDLVETYGKFTEESMGSEIMFSAFDNMEARKLMFEKWKKIPNRRIFIDGRMQAEYFEVYAVTPEREEQYEAELFDDSEVPDLPCSAKATTHCGAMCGATMVSMFNNFITNEKDNSRELPFKFSISLQLFMTEIEYDVEIDSI